MIVQSALALARCSVEELTVEEKQTWVRFMNRARHELLSFGDRIQNLLIIYPPKETSVRSSSESRSSTGSVTPKLSDGEKIKNKQTGGASWTGIKEEVFLKINQSLRTRLPRASPPASNADRENPN